MAIWRLMKILFPRNKFKNEKKLCELKKKWSIKNVVIDIEKCLKFDEISSQTPWQGSLYSGNVWSISGKMSASGKKNSSHVSEHMVVKLYFHSQCPRNDAQHCRRAKRTMNEIPRVWEVAIFIPKANRSWLNLLLPPFFHLPKLARCSQLCVMLPSQTNTRLPYKRTVRSCNLPIFHISFFSRTRSTGMKIATINTCQTMFIFYEY